MSVLTLVREDLRGFAGYSSARREAQGGSVLLNANESPWPAGALALNRYPDPQPEALKQRLAELYGVAAERLLIGRGSDEAIDLLVRALCRAGRDAVLITPPTFGMYAVAARVQDAAVQELRLTPETGFTLDVDALLAAVQPNTKIVFICAPNNPTGTTVPEAALRRLALGLAGRALLVIDEAYAEFAQAAPGIALAAAFPQVAVLRTLSKAYALAAARIGVLIAAPELIALLRNLMAPYPLPTPCVEAALQALQPEAVRLARSRIALIREERERLAAGLAATAAVAQVFPADGNFLLLRCHEGAAWYRRALAAGIVLRDVSAQPGLANCLRVSIGTPQENDAVLQLFTDPDAIPGHRRSALARDIAGKRAPTASTDFIRAGCSPPLGQDSASASSLSLAQGAECSAVDGLLDDDDVAAREAAA